MSTANDNPTVAENREAGTLEWQLRNVRFDDPVTLASFPLVRHLTSSAIQGICVEDERISGGGD